MRHIHSIYLSLILFANYNLIFDYNQANSVQNYAYDVFTPSSNSYLISYLEKGFKFEEFLQKDTSCITINIADNLGKNQIWEKITLRIDGKKYFFQVNLKKPNTFKDIKFKSEGSYKYSIYAEALFDSNKSMKSKSFGELVIKKNSKNKFTFNLIGDTSQDEYSLSIINRNVIKILD